MEVAESFENYDLAYLISNGIIDSDDIHNKIQEMNNQKYLNEHRSKIWNGKGDNSKYWYTYVYVNDKRKLVRKNSEKELKDYLIHFYKENANKTFFSFYQKWKDRKKLCGVSDNTLVRYDQDYNRFIKGNVIEDMNISSITTSHIENLIFAILNKNEIKYKALTQIFNMISGVFQKAMFDKEIISNPCSYIDLQIYKKRCKDSGFEIEKRILFEEDCKNLIATLRKTYKEKPWQISTYAVEFALLTGMRAGEIGYLKWEHIYQNDGYILVCGSAKRNRKTGEFYNSQTKTGKIRKIPLTDAIIDFLKILKQVEIKYGYLSEYVFSDKNGQIKLTTLYSIGQKKTSQSGSKATGLQALRRTYNSQLKVMGVPTIIAASILGHSEEVNNNFYSYDTSNMDYKREVATTVNKNLCLINA